MFTSQTGAVQVVVQQVGDLVTAAAAFAHGNALPVGVIVANLNSELDSTEGAPQKSCKMVVPKPTIPNDSEVQYEFTRIVL